MKLGLLCLALLLASLGCVREHVCREGTAFVTVRFLDSPQMVDGVALKYKLDETGTFVEISPPVARPSSSDRGGLELQIGDYGKHTKLTLSYVPTKGGMPVGGWQETTFNLATGCSTWSLDVRVVQPDAGWESPDGDVEVSGLERDAARERQQNSGGAVGTGGSGGQPVADAASAGGAAGTGGQPSTTIQGGSGGDADTDGSGTGGTTADAAMGTGGFTGGAAGTIAFGTGGVAVGVGGTMIGGTTATIQTSGVTGSGGLTSDGGGIASGGIPGTGGMATTGGSATDRDASADRSNSDTASSPPPNVMFVTSLSYTGDLGGLAGADQKCQARAEAAGLAGKYIAFLSTSTTPALSRFGDSRGWIRTDGRPFADRQEDIAAGAIFYPPRMDEFGTDVPLGYAYTGTLAGGTPDIGHMGTDWGPPEADGGDWLCSSGSVTGGKIAWTQSIFGGCNGQHHLYCFGIDRHSIVIPPSPEGATRLAFLSNAQFSPSTGRDAADGICMSEASQAMLPGSFLALLSTSSQSAVSRFNLTAPPWVRPDGLYVVASASDIQSGRLLSPIELRIDGSPSQSTGVWSGASSVEALGAYTCKNWTSSSSSDLGYYGEAMESNTSWFAGGSPMSCSNPVFHVYCFEQ